MLALRTLPLLIASVRTYLSNVSRTSVEAGPSYSAAVMLEELFAASGPSAQAHNAHLQAVQADVYAKLFADKFAEIESRFAAAALQQQKPAGGGGAKQPRQWTKHYCYVHGTCGHPGSECKTMLADRGKYSNAKLKAKTPTDVAGGSRRV